MMSSYTGIANARTYCGHAYVEVGRTVSGVEQYRSKAAYNTLASVIFQSGSRSYELMSLWD
jgi:hypothetical protein